MRPLAGLAALFVILAALSFSPAGARAQEPAIDWRECGRFECGTLAVPLDYANPGGKLTEIAVVKRPANNEDDRIGALFANPGGPGASGIEFVRLWSLILDDDILDRFDIIGWDPRGIGESDPLLCHDNLKEYIAADPTPDDEAEFETLREITEKFAAGCAEAAGDALNFYGTKNVARDMDQIRQALGDDQLSYIGYSYGTVIGQVYAQHFPERVRAMVLDGAVDLSLNSEELAQSQAQGFERALNNFLEDCRSDGDDCRLNKRGDPADVIEKLLAKVEEAPIPSKDADRPAGPGETVLGLIAPLYSVSWNHLDRIIDEALDGDGTGIVRSADSYLERKGNDYSNITEANMAVNCIDHPDEAVPQSYAEYRAKIAGQSNTSALLSDALAAGFGCAFWEAEPDPLEPPTGVSGTPPIVILSTTGDPATPYQWGVAVSKQLASSVLVTYKGEGHTVYGGRDGCIDELVNHYLVELEPPAEGSECGDGPPVPDSSATPGASETPAPRATATTGNSGDDDSDDEATSVAWTIVGVSALLVFGLLATGIIIRSRRA